MDKGSSTTGLEPALSPDGSQVAFTRWDEPRGLWLINSDGSNERQIFKASEQIMAPKWSPDGKWIAHIMGGSVCVTNTSTGETLHLTKAFADAEAPRPEACVFSPDGSHVAYVRPVAIGGTTVDLAATSDQPTRNQIFICTLNAR